MAEKEENEEDLDFDDDFDDEEDLGWSFNYFLVCILLPAFNGFINGYSWSGLSLHYVEMGWPLTNVGWPCMIGFALRLVFQQVQMRAGFWVSVPLAIVHLGTAIVGTIYTTEEWAVALEIAVMQGVDPSITVEGIAFDVFGLSEELARQASSTVLAVFTIAVASAVTIGGIIYDGFGWKGMSVFHVICQSGMLLLFATQPVVWRSFREFFFKASSEDEEESDMEAALPVVPTEPSGSTKDDLQLEDITEHDLTLPGAAKDEAPVQSVDPGADDQKATSKRETQASSIGRETTTSVVVQDRKTQALQQNRGRKTQDSQGSRGRKTQDSQGSRGRKTQDSQGSRGRKTQDSQGSRGRKTQDSQGSRGRKTQDSQGSRGRKTQDSQGSRGEGTRATRASRASRASNATRKTQLTRVTGMTHGTVLTGKTAHTIRTALTARSHMTKGTSKTQGTVLSRMTALASLKEGDDFQYHFGTHNALRPTIAQRAGALLNEEEEEEFEDEYGDELKPKGIPKDIRIPSFLIVLCCFNNTAAYVMEFATFAIFFKEFHKWEAATWASLAQTSGDLVAAVMMKVLRNDVDEAENVGWLRRIIMQPYNLACLLFCWTLCNLGMISPLLPVAVTAQIIMGTAFVYTIKMSTDLNLFYSMGDTAVFLKLQVYCKNAEALGGCIFSFLGPFLFENVNAFFPFVVTTCMSALIFIIFTAGHKSSVLTPLAHLAALLKVLELLELRPRGCLLGRGANMGADWIDGCHHRDLTLDLPVGAGRRGRFLGGLVLRWSPVRLLLQPHEEGGAAYSRPGSCKGDDSAEKFLERYQGWTNNPNNEPVCMPDANSQPVIDGAGTAFVPFQDGHVYAVRDANGDGKISPDEVQSHHVGDAFQASLAMAPKMLVALDCQGRLKVFKD